MRIEPHPFKEAGRTGKCAVCRQVADHRNHEIDFGAWLDIQRDGNAPYGAACANCGRTIEASDDEEPVRLCDDCAGDPDVTGR